MALNLKGPGRGKPGVKNPKKASKFKNQSQYVDGRFFHSKSEAERYKHLRQLEAEGYISQLECQPAYSITINNSHICKCILDFRYIDHSHSPIQRVEDVKGMRTDMYRLKKKLVEAEHQIEVIEVPASAINKWKGALPHKTSHNQKVWLPNRVIDVETE